jgi:hypothetical protein
MTAIEPSILLITADAATVSEGKINILGGGWTRITPGPANFTLVVRVDIPWNMRNQQLPWSLKLVDQDGRPYIPDGGEVPVELTGDLQMERHGISEPGSSFEAPMLFPFIGLPLRPGTYDWVFTLAQFPAKYGFQVL